MAERSPRDAIAQGRLQTLADKVRGLDAVFSCGGSISLAGPVELRFRGSGPIRVEGADGWQRTDVGKRLARRCKPAPFGIGRDTRHDPRVRDGGQLLATGGSFRVVGLDLASTGILAEIHRALCADDATPPEAELYALNVYERSGHFVPHKDTPRDLDVFGTVVACLPVPFRGGRLVLRHGTTQSYDWQSTSYHGFGRRDQSYPVKWAAFYGDVDHEVEPVTGGARVTLTWLLRRAARVGLDTRRPASTEADLEAAFAAALADPGFMPRGGVLGVPCLHLYAQTPGLVRPSEALSAATTARLKGRDRLVALATLRAGLATRYRPYLYDAMASGSWRLSRAPTQREAAIFRRRQLGASTLETSIPIEHDASGWGREDDVTWVLLPPWADDEDALAEAEPTTEFLGALEYSATGYFGNEGSDAAFYVAAALLITVPPARERAGVRVRRARRGVSAARTRAGA
jgi:hypothetical protein